MKDIFAYRSFKEFGFDFVLSIGCILLSVIINPQILLVVIYASLRIFWDGMREIELYIIFFGIPILYALSYVSLLFGALRSLGGRR
jgi:hypothetical protein